MTNLFKALLFAGLFILTGTSQANDWPASIDWGAKTMPSENITVTWCKGNATYGYPDFTIEGKKLSSDCSLESSKRFMDKVFAHHNQGRTCPSRVVRKYDNGWEIQRYEWSDAAKVCGAYSTPIMISAGSELMRWESSTKCPPNATGQPKEDAYKAKFRIKLKERKPDGSAGAADVCYKPLDPISCAALKGYGTTGSDYFITDSPDYKHPSCITIIDQDKDGNRKAGNCQVIAKSWVQQPVGAYGGNMKQWTPMVGTITGVSCGAEEQKQEPPEELKPKCWKSTNNLNMCQQDPLEKCVTVNGVSKCETGCGYINGDFWCAQKDDSKNPAPPKSDTVPTDPTDTITDPTKTMANMTKADFKDAQIGVESRLTQVNTTITNVENSIDQSNTLLSDIALNTEQNLTDNNIQNGLLSGIKEGVDKLANGTGDGSGEGEGNGDCLPTDKTCNGAGTAAPASWWKTSYPEGVEGIVERNKQAFMNSEAFEAMGGSGMAQTGGVNPSFNFCFNFGIANFGCQDLTFPSEIWAFLRAIILFMAALYCRSIIFGK